MKLLHIDASPRRDSVSRGLTSHFVKNWKRQNPSGEVIYRDLTSTPVTAVTEDWIQAAYSDPQNHTPSHRQAIFASELFIRELADADVIVIGDPMHNFGTSATLKSWIDQVVRAGKTFRYGEFGFEGLLKGKKVYVLTSRGSTYAPGTPMASFDFQEPYLRTILGFIGLTDVTFIHAENQSRPDLADAGRKNAIQKIEEAVGA